MHFVGIVLFFGPFCVQGVLIVVVISQFYSCLHLQVKMDRFSYAIPIVCVLPITIIVCLSMCEAKRAEPCYFAHLLPDSVGYGGSVIYQRDFLVGSWF